MSRRDNEQADFSRDVLEAFRKRSRAISRLGVTLDCVPVKEIVDGQESAIGRLDVSLAYRVEGAQVILRVHAWGDRWVWIDARRTSKVGWAWEWTGEGRFLSSNGARALVECTEETIDASWLPANKAPSSIAGIWSPVLAKGPRELK